MKKTGYSEYKTGINYNKENKLFKAQERCAFLSLDKWSSSLYTDHLDRGRKMNMHKTVKTLCLGGDSGKDLQYCPVIFQ